MTIIKVPTVKINVTFEVSSGSEEGRKVLRLFEGLSMDYEGFYLNDILDILKGHLDNFMVEELGGGEYIKHIPTGDDIEIPF